MSSRGKTNLSIGGFLAVSPWSPLILCFFLFRPSKQLLTHWSPEYSAYWFYVHHHISSALCTNLFNKLSSLFSSLVTNMQSFSIPSISLGLQITTTIFFTNINIKNKLLRKLQFNNYIMFRILYLFLKAYGRLDHKTLMFRHNNKVLLPIF